MQHSLLEKPKMKRFVVVLVLFGLLGSVAAIQAHPRNTRASKKASKASVRYGDNPAAGRTFEHDGIRFYYEVYGTGEPMLLVHGNGGGIADLSAQIAHFRKRYRVIAMDSRSQGKSGDSPTKITYEAMCDDLAALLDHLKTGPVYVLGWSDGGIEALLLGIRHPSKVKKIAAMAANLNPSSDAIYPEIIAVIESMIAAVPEAERNDPKVRRDLAVTQMLLEEPHIELASLAAITTPTLVLAADHDLIRDEHTVAIYRQLPNAQLVIFPNATHMIPFDDPATFNAAVDRFFRTPFVKVDRIKDTLESLERMRAPAGHAH